MEESEILKKLGINSTNKWTLDDGGSQFFSWCVQNLNPVKNIIAERESLEIKSSELSEIAAYELESKYPGIFSIDKHSVTEKESIVRQIEEENNERNDRIIRLEEFARVEINFEKHATLEIQQNELELKRQAKEVRGIIKVSEDKRKANIKRMSRSAQLKSDNFLFQLSSDHYLNNINKICDNTQIFMREHFNVNNKEEVEAIQDSLEMALTSEKNQILKLSQFILDQEIHIASLEAVQHITEQIMCAKDIKSNEKRMLAQEWLLAEENLSQQLETSLQDLQLLQKQEPPFKPLYRSLCQTKLDENLSVLKKLNQVKMLLDEVLSISEVFWAATEIDMKRLQNRPDSNSEEVNNLLIERSKRINQLENNSMSDEKVSYNNLVLIRMQKVLKKVLSLPHERISNIELCVKQVLSLKDRLDVLTRSACEQQFVSRIFDVISEVEIYLNNINDHIYCGPLSKPCLYESKYFSLIYKRDKKREEFDRQWQEIRGRIQKNINEPFKNNKFHRMKTLLGIWFLTEPKKVQLAINEAQSKAAESGSKSYKALNITMNNK